MAQGTVSVYFVVAIFYRRDFVVDSRRPISSMFLPCLDTFVPYMDRSSRVIDRHVSYRLLIPSGLFFSLSLFTVESYLPHLSWRCIRILSQPGIEFWRVVNGCFSSLTLSLLQLGALFPPPALPSQIPCNLHIHTDTRFHQHTHTHTHMTFTHIHTRACPRTIFHSFLFWNRYFHRLILSHWTLYKKKNKRMLW